MPVLCPDPKLVQVYYTVGIMSPKGKGDANERTIKSIYKAAGWDLLGIHPVKAAA